MVGSKWSGRSGKPCDINLGCLNSFVSVNLGLSPLPTRIMKRISPLSLFAIVGLAVITMGCGSSKRSGSSDSRSGSGDRPSIAFVTNGSAAFWVIAKAGVEQAGKEFDADASVLMPADVSDQKRMIEDLITKGADGIAISPIDPDNQTDLINEAAQYAHVITHDGDAPKSDRECYIGMDNYLAGRMCGELVVEALPEGGKIAIFIGRVEQDNARRRRQGLIDEILGRSEDPSRFDPSDTPIQEGKWNIVGTYTDQFDRVKGKANAEDAMSRHSDLAGMVGLFEYNPPLMLEAAFPSRQAGENQGRRIRRGGRDTPRNHRRNSAWHDRSKPV